MNYIAELNSVVQQSFSNPYDAMTELFGTEGEADVYVVVGGKREGLLHRNAEGVWSSA